MCDELGIVNNYRGDAEWVRTSTSGNQVFWNDMLITKGIMPDVTGMTLRDAVYILEQCGAKVKYQGKGRVTNQSIYPGYRIGSGETITIELS